MAQDFFKNIIQKDGTIGNVPSITIKKRDTDKYIIYDKKTMRLDNVSGDIYDDESLWRLIMWGNPEYYIEFDIEDGTVIRVPFPKENALEEVMNKLM